MATIEDRIDIVSYLLGNRTDINDRIIQWIIDAYRELTSNVSFKELEETQEDVFVAGQDTYDYPTTAQSVKALIGLTSTGSPYPIKKRDIRIVENYTAVNRGRPAIWAPWKNTIIVRPTPSTADTLRWRFWLKPVIQAPPNEQSTTLQIPDEWLTIIDHLAAMMGHTALGQQSQAQMISVLVHGDPKNPQQPGWIKQKLMREAKENVVSDYATDPMTRPYTIR